MPALRGGVVRILVTGGAGFIGSHIVDCFVSDDHEVFVVDNSSSGVRYESRAAHYFGDNLADHWSAGLKAAITRVDAIVHAAAYANLRAWTQNEGERERLRRDNVDATARLLEHAPAVPIVYLGTASVYGTRYEPWGSPLSHGAHEGDESPETCESWYAATKLTGEHLVAAWAHWKRVPWHVARLVNVVGARTHRGVIADFVRMYRATGRIHAADDGRQRKSWVHVADVVDAVTLMVQGGDVVRSSSGSDLGDRPPSGVYNVTSEERWSWRDIVREMGVPPSRVTWEARDRGAVGDPFDLHVSGMKLAPWFRCQRPVALGVQQALSGMNWVRPTEAA